MKSNVLKYCVFATGLSGIVAEYILATLATYFLGDSVVQWALIVSVMMFSMGIGSRLSKHLNKNLLLSFIAIEFLLSLTVAFSPLISFTVASFTTYTGIVIYSLSIMIGMMIGMEIPLVIRLNHQFEELRTNISSVMEKDYYGSLLGGLFFVFVGMPYLGLTYTPFVLGAINFLVAISLIIVVYNQIDIKKRPYILGAVGIVTIILVVGIFVAKPIMLFGEQAKYKDKVIFEKQTKYQRIVMTKWKDNYWLYLNGNLQFSSFDEPLYHEPLVHIGMKISKKPREILIIGGGDGCAVREILKYDFVNKIDLCDLDPAITELAKTNPILKKINHNSMNNKKVNIYNEDGFIFLENSKKFYDLIIIDLPDPRSIPLSRLYSYEFYTICKKSLRPQGVMITQATSPYYAADTYRCIDKTMGAAGFTTIKLHNQIPTMGEWGWIIGKPAKNEHIADSILFITQIHQLDFSDIETKWITQSAVMQMTNFGKEYFNNSRTIKINKINEPVLYKYYLKSIWDIY